MKRIAKIFYLLVLSIVLAVSFFNFMSIEIPAMLKNGEPGTIVIYSDGSDECDGAPSNCP